MLAPSSSSPVNYVLMEVDHPRSGKNPSYRDKIGPDDLLFQLVFFSTYEELNLPMHGPMEDAEVRKFYDPSIVEMKSVCAWCLYKYVPVQYVLVCTCVS